MSPIRRSSDVAALPPHAWLLRAEAQGPWSSRPSGRRCCARPKSVFARLASPVATTALSTPCCAAHASASGAWHVSVRGTSASCVRCVPGRAPVLQRDVYALTSSPSSVAADRRLPCGPWTDRSQWPASSSALRVCPRERVRSPRARIHRPGWKAPGPCVWRDELARVWFCSAYVRCDASSAPQPPEQCVGFDLDGSLTSSH